MKKIQIIFLGIIFFTAASLGIAQTQPIETGQADEEANEDEFDKSEKWTDKIVLGGNLGAQFGSSTYIEVSPIVGYRITEKLTSGVGFSYQYFSQNNDGFTSFKQTVMAARVYSQYDLIYGIFAHAEFEQAWYKLSFDDATLGTFTGQSPALFVGGGYNIPIGARSKFQILALYDVLHTSESIYYNPWIFRFGINFGI